MQYEAYCVSGVKGMYYLVFAVFNSNSNLSSIQGVVNNYVQDLLELKKKTAAIITQKLSK